jgi:hypothetical protein
MLARFAPFPRVSLADIAVVTDHQRVLAQASPDSIMLGEGQKVKLALPMQSIDVGLSNHTY